MEKGSRLAMSHQHRGFQLAVQDHRRRAPEAVSQAVVESSARHETNLALELGATQSRRINSGVAGARFFCCIGMKLKSHSDNKAPMC